jgi:hypothetical protein
MSKVFGTSNFIRGTGPTGESVIVAEADHMQFCPCLGCCQSDHLLKRTYTKVYDGFIEANRPISLCCFDHCFGEMCVLDMIGKTYFDRPPFLQPLGCISKCCGPPVIFIGERPVFCCGFIDCTDNCGIPIAAAPHTCCNCKACIFCGPKCYRTFALPYMSGLKEPSTFLAKMAAALKNYAGRNNIPNDQMAICEDDQGQPLIIAMAELNAKIHSKD